MQCNDSQPGRFSLAGLAAENPAQNMSANENQKKRLNKKRSTMFSCKYITVNDNDDTTEKETKIRAIPEQSGGVDKGA